jgi:hypothetical protein
LWDMHVPVVLGVGEVSREEDERCATLERERDYMTSRDMTKHQIQIGDVM